MLDTSRCSHKVKLMYIKEMNWQRVERKTVFSVRELFYIIQIMRNLLCLAAARNLTKRQKSHLKRWLFLYMVLRLIRKITDPKN